MAQRFVPGLSFRRVAAWLCIGLCGGVWGVGLARALALELLGASSVRPFFFSVTGVGLLSFLGAAMALFIAVSRQPPAISDDAMDWKTALGRLPLLLPAVDIVGGTFVPWRGPVLLLGSLGMTLLCAAPRGLSRRAGFIIAVAIPLLVYLPDLSPYVGRADTFEFQIVAPRLGIAHPSGYPLYILIGKLFSLLPFGAVAWRVNLSSAVCAALASGVLFLALSEWANERIRESANQQMANSPSLTQNLKSKIQNPVALLAALTLAFSPTLWARAIEAEVYALNALFTATALWVITRWATGKLQAQRALPLMGLLTGLAITSHITLGALVFLALPLLVARPRPTWRTLLSAVGLGLAGLSLYGYIPLRWPAVNNGEVMSLGHFLRFVTNAESGGALHPLAFIQDPTRWTLVFRLLRMQVGWVGLALAAVGLGGFFLNRSALRKSQLRIVGVGTLLAFGAWVWFNLSFYVADPDYSALLIPAHAILIFWLGAASGEWQIANSKWQIANYAPRITFHVLITLLALLPLSRLWITGPGLDTIAEGRADEAWGRYALQQPLAANAAILADSEKFPPLYYLQQAEAQRPDLEMVMRFDEAGYFEEMHTRLAAGQRVYLARYLPGMDAYGVSAVGPLAEVAPPESAASEPAAPVTFDDILILTTYRLEADPQGRRMHHLTLTWEPVAPVSQDLAVQLRLVTPDGDIVWSGGGQRPVNGYSTTQAWQAGQHISDYYALAWPDWLPGGDETASSLRLEIALAPRFSADVLAPGWVAVENVTLPWAIAGRNAVQPALFSGPLSNGALWLEGHDLPGEVAAESPLVFTLTWLRAGDLPEDARPQFYWMPLDNARWEPPVMPEALPVHVWPENQRVQQRYTLTAPWLPGRYRLWVSWIADGEWLPAQCRWLARTEAHCALAELTVGPSTAGLANFGGQLLLVDATLDATRAAPGATLPLTLYWRALRAPTENYTVFAQIVGPEGKLYGQVDSWPVQGTRPTGSWRSGEEINDPYQLTLAPDAPPGEYQVIVGWYLLGTMERLAVLDAGGQAVGDYYVVGGFTIGE